MGLVLLSDLLRSLVVRRFIFFVCLIFLILPFSAFAQQLPPINPATVTGDMAIAGSSILAPITNNLVTRFNLEGYSGNIAVNTNDSQTAFQQLCDNEVDIVMADRQILPQEVDACTAANRPPIAFRISTSAIIVAVSPQNTFAGSMSSSELQQVFSTALAWNEVRADWSVDPINRFGPLTDSSEFDLFATVLFGGDRSMLITAIGAQYTSDQAVRLQSVSSSNAAIGFFDATFALANANVLSAVTIDNVAATRETIVDNSYPLSRPLLLYTTSQEFSEDTAVVSFLNYYLSNVEVEANAAGLFAPPSTALEVARNRWLSASGQSAPVQAATAIPTATPFDSIAATATALAEFVDNTTPEGEVSTASEGEAIATPAGPSQTFTPEVQELLVQARLDLELIADEISRNRPEGWSGSLDIENPQLPLLIRLDLEVLAAGVYGIENRPIGWFGPVSSTQDAISRDIRHDLELLANNVLGSGRPVDWAGGEPIHRCDRSTQALASLLEENGLYTLTADTNSPEYCTQVSQEVSRFTEVNLLNTNVRIDEDGVGIPADVTIESTLGVAFFSRAANRRAGLMPVGTGITPIGRSYQGFSNMTLIRGAGFLVFVEWQNTSLTQAEWRALPDEAGFEYETECTASWCEGQP